MVLPDAAPGQLLFRITPRSWQPYLQLARLDRPIGWWLLVLPCWWSSALASIAAHQPPHVSHLALFVVGAMAMRGAGSTYNDIIDRYVDAKVERTRYRPIPSGRVSVAAARIFLVFQALIGLAVVLCFSRFTILLGMASLVIVAIYPFMKRISSWPQLVLGLAFAWGGLVGWAAAMGSLAGAPVWLYAGAVLWTIGYDTIYAIQDARDDPAAGIKSTARMFGASVRPAVGVIYGGALILIEGALFSAGIGGNALAQLGVAGFALHLGRQIWRVDAADPVGALALFRSNRDAGLILFAGLALAALAQVA
ncbi:4-hydroxybenzoate octaprenyltransferase [Beijerinckia sp. L45]|uniref:4-hydroxybenzoate octaprenyltransferase n=1 Tax=Beijerinckia sp. L45 TaxID=1641855 RepID=UPI001FEEB429|nr:4-hydroxybenzoate octaprenyltransferase [Beijerinckia sp. L45]